ncbi:MAG: hypothetical protein ACEPOZ_03450 [Marinifilaceae bacterium]
MKNKKQKFYLTIAFIVLASSQLLTHFYRPFIYSSKINDYGFADTIGSLVSVIGICFLFWGTENYSNKEKNKHIFLATIIYSVIWEPLGLLGIHGTFDWKDIIATFISGIITFLLKEIIEKKIDRSDKPETKIS